MKPNHINKNPLVNGNYLTDGGLETTMIFYNGLDLPHFAAFDLLSYEEGKNTLLDYYNSYIDIAQKYQLNFTLETPTWRASQDWGFKLGYSEKELQKINKDAVGLMRNIQHNRKCDIRHIIIAGQIGPRGDGYTLESKMTHQEAKDYHFPQMRTFAEENVDLVTALTINYSDEGIGIVKAAQELEIPVVISFTVETDGRLPSGESLQEAIEKTDKLTDDYVLYYMINCAHPEHFKEVLLEKSSWKNRIQGIRSNASNKSHAELDESETLDAGDKCLLANEYQDLKNVLPQLKVFGGCCGTDHTHMEIICETMFPHAAAKAS
jgi:S-methylmethionine-dependent homocysteine/selenocysteine methylase